MIKDFINKNYERLHNIIMGYNVDDKEDIFQETLLYFLQMEKSKCDRLIKSGEASKYIIQMFKINAFSSTSPYQRTYENNTDVAMNEDTDENVCWGDFITELEGLDIFFLDKVLYKTYLERKIETPSYSIKKLSLEIDISHSSLRDKFREIKNKLKDKL